MDEVPDRAEVLVVGGGPGGYAAAFRAADLGLDVTLVGDEPRLGGVCLLRGCIPSKALLEVAELITLAGEAAANGVGFGDPEIDVDRLRGWKDDVVGELVDGLGTVADKRGVRVVRATAEFTSSGEAHLTGDDGEADLAFDHAIVATGSEPVALPDMPFGERVIDSARALELPDVPGRLLVVGGGYVGLELGSVYAALGSEVTLVEMTDRLLTNADEDLVEPLERSVRGRFADVRLRTTVTGMEERDEDVRVTFESEDDVPGEDTYDRVLVAVGRRPRTQGIGLDDAGVDVDDRGFVVVDEQRRTSVDRIFAIGDVAGGMMLAHEAMDEGMVAAEVIGGKAAAFDRRAIPAVVYTDPQIAWCGLTERDAHEHDVDVEVTRFPWRASGRALTLGSTGGMTKLLTEPDTGRVLGMGIVGRRAESLIAQGVLAIEMGAVAEDIAYSVAAHPTLSETIHEAAQRVLGHPTHLVPSRGSSSRASSGG